MATPIDTPSRKTPLIKAAELSTLAPLENLCGTHLIARGFNIIYGPSGVYKSFYALDKALTVAQTHQVVYIAAEGSSGLHQRVQAWCTHNKVEPGGLFFLCQELNLRDKDSISTFMAWLKVEKIKPELIVFDTLARCFVGGDEIAAKDTGMAIHYSALLQREFDTATLWIHHSNRAETGERGSGAIRGAADMMIEMGLDENDVVKVSCSKVKDSEAWPIEAFQFSKIDTSGILLPLDTMTKVANDLSRNQIKLLLFLNQTAVKDCGAKVAQIKEALSLHLATVYKIISSLEDVFAISHAKVGDPYSLTANGERLCSQLLAKKSNVLSLVGRKG